MRPLHRRWGIAPRPEAEIVQLSSFSISTDLRLSYHAFFGLASEKAALFISFHAILTFLHPYYRAVTQQNDQQFLDPPACERLQR